MTGRIRVVAIESKYPQNLGYMARAMKNFGVTDLILVNPRCKYKEGQAIKYAKHARELLEKAKVAKSLTAASKGFVIGTTGIWKKADNNFYNIANLSALRNKPAWKRSKDITIVLGRDDTGLTTEEIRECDALVFIGANDDYPVLNISHALAILLYEFTLLDYAKKYSFAEQFYADDKYQKRLIMLFDKFVKENKSVRDKKAVAGAFRRVLKRAAPTKMEINAICIALSRSNRK
jgi:tRNA/rRNA methyltransferase